MAHLEEITVGCQLNGIAARETVTVIAVQWYGNAALEVTFKNSRGQLGSQILYRGDEATVDVLGDSLPWSFGADADKMRLVSEAYRIHLAHLFDPYLAVHTSAIQPLPHQITAVYQEMLPRLPLRYILADDPGAGKTIMTVHQGADCPRRFEALSDRDAGQSGGTVAGRAFSQISSAV